MNQSLSLEYLHCVGELTDTRTRTVSVLNKMELMVKKKYVCL